MKKVLLFIKWMVLLSVLGLLAWWGQLNSQPVSWNLMVLSEPLTVRVSTVMAAMLFGGFLLGMVTSFYIVSKMKFAAALKRRKLEKQRQKQSSATTSKPAEMPVLGSGE